ncbi:hypothetical protein ACFY0G_02100 [Streptomyces sp. NPDC001552]|uniref:hypothetical protein n=1 Tax=Streptomyces sp. NPDC001552 TaxID=3364587 RepID=UPI0036B4F2E1
MAATPPPVPGPNESVEDIHAYAAADYAGQDQAREHDGQRPEPSPSGFTVTSNPYSGEQIVRPFPR